MTTFSDTRALVILEAQYALVRPSQPERSEAYVPEALVDFFAGERVRHTFQADLRDRVRAPLEKRIVVKG